MFRQHQEIKYIKLKQRIKVTNILVYKATKLQKGIKQRNDQE